MTDRSSDRDLLLFHPDLSALPPVPALPDGYRLPVSVWQSRGEPQAIVMALHGFNDYRNAFEATGRALAVHGIVTYAYDQRGFGKTPVRGRWSSTEVMGRDLKTLIHLIKQKYPDPPLYLLGHSMGALHCTTFTSMRPQRLPGRPNRLCPLQCALSAGRMSRLPREIF